MAVGESRKPVPHANPETPVFRFLMNTVGRSRWCRYAVYSLPRSWELRQRLVTRYLAWLYNRVADDGQPPTRFFHPQVTGFQASELLGQKTTFENRADMETAFADVRDALGDMAFQLFRVIDHDPYWVCLCHAHARGGTSGVEVSRDVGFVFKWEKGWTTYVAIYWHPEQALEAVGLSE